MLSKFDFSMTGETQILYLVILLTLSSSRSIVILLTLASQNRPDLFIFTNFHSYFTEFEQDIRLQKQFKHSLAKNSRTTHSIWHKSFSMIQSAGITNLVPHLINRFLRFNLLFPSRTRFSDLRDKIKYA